MLVDVQGAFPGWIALWPLLSAAAIIVAGRTGSPFGLDRILASAPLVRLGDSAYALYLIHWPVLITYLVLRDRPMAGPRSGAAIVLVCLVLAVLVTMLVVLTTDAYRAYVAASGIDEQILGAARPRLQAVEETAGVREADVTFKRKTAIVDFDEETVQQSTLVKKIQDLGYQTTVADEQQKGAAG